MSLLSTFCTNSINILAGVNGVEVRSRLRPSHVLDLTPNILLRQVGQALVIALSIAANDLLYISFDLAALPFVGRLTTEPCIVGLGLARGSVELADRHLFSLYFMLPLIGVCLGLLQHNWFVSAPIAHLRLA